MLRYNTNPPHLYLIKVVSLSEALIPTGLCAGSSGELLWVVSGVSKLTGGDNLVARLRVINGFKGALGDESLGQLGVLKDDEVPGSKELLLELQGSVLIDEDWVCEVGKGAKAALSGQFVKKQYSLENREFRKRTRNDKKR